MAALPGTVLVYPNVRCFFRPTVPDCYGGNKTDANVGARSLT
jgi:hypothetical protein